jgi:hypothetical protein
VNQPLTKEAMTSTPTRNEVRGGGGVYIYRTRKPSSLLGLAKLPFRWLAVGALVACLGLHFTGGPWPLGLVLLLMTGRHFAYVGETVSFKDRHGEHMSGGGRWKKGAASWSDLDAVCVLRIPHPKWKWLLRSTETLLITILAPVYNEKKNRANLRRITRAQARRMRLRRDKRTVKLNVPTPRPAHILFAIGVWLILHIGGVL